MYILGLTAQAGSTSSETEPTNTTILRDSLWRRTLLPLRRLSYFQLVFKIVDVVF